MITKSDLKKGTKLIHKGFGTEYEVVQRLKHHPVKGFFKIVKYPDTGWSYETINLSLEQINQRLILKTKLADILAIGDKNRQSSVNYIGTKTGRMFSGINVQQLARYMNIGKSSP